MALEKVNLACIWRLCAKEALKLSGIIPRELIDCNIAEIWAWVNIFWELIAQEAQWCDILLIDKIYETPEAFSYEVDRALKEYKKDLEDIIKLHQSFPSLPSREAIYSLAKTEIERSIHLLETSHRIKKLLWGPEEAVGQDNRIQRLPEFPEEMKGTMHYVCMTSLFYNVHEPAEFLAEIDTYLDEDGKIIIIEPRGTYIDGWKFNMDSLLEYLKKIWEKGQKKLWIRIVSEDHEFFSAIEFQKGAHTRVKFPKNK